MARREFKWNSFERLRVKYTGFSRQTKRSGATNANHARRFVVSRWESIQEIRQRITFWLIGMGLLIALVAVQFIWISGSYMQTAPVAGGTYKEGMVGDVSTLNPLYVSSTPEESIASLVYSSLYKYDEQGGVKGDLAADIKTEDEDKTYIVTIRNDASWQDGKPVTADDVMYTIDLMQAQESRSSAYSSWQNIKASKVNQHSLKFELDSVYAPFKHALMFPILPKHVLSKIEPSKLRESVNGVNLIGSGPYSIVSMQDVEEDDPYNVVRLKRSDNYYGGLPNIERIQIYSYGSDEALVKALSDGDIDAGSGLGALDSAKVKNKRYVTHDRPSASGVYALFNTSTGLLKDQKIRSALQIGTDIDGLLDQYPIKMNKLVGPFTNRHVDASEVIKPKYDVERAKSILEKAGWKLGKDNLRHKDKQILSLNVVTVKNSDYEQAAEELANQWKLLGVETSVSVVDGDDPSQNVASTVLQPRSYDVLIYELFLGGDPDVYAYWHSTQAESGGLNLSNFSDQVSDDILVSARSRLESNLRDAKYQSLANRWLEKSPAIALYESDFVYIAKPRIQSVRDDSYIVTPESHFTDVIYWTVKETEVYKTP